MTIPCLRRVRWIAVAIAGCAVVPITPAGAAVGTPADAAATADGTSYTCAVQGDPAPEAVTVAMTLDSVPASVRPGASVVVTGHLALTFPAAVAGVSHLELASQASLGVTSISPVVTNGGWRHVLPAILTPQDPAPIGRPFVLGADVTLASFTVPQDASGRLVVSLPRDATVANTVGATPAEVAFTSQISQNSLLVGGRAVSCWLAADQATPVLARIKVVPGARSSGAPATSPGASSSVPAPSSAHEVTVGDPSGAGVSAPAVTTVPPSAAPVAETVPTTDPVSATPVLVQAAAIPAPTVHGGTFIPYWEIALMGFTFPAAAVVLALVQRRRLAAARRLAADLTPSS